MESTIPTHARDSTMLIMGATEAGLLRRFAIGLLVFEGLEDVDCSVVLAERPSDRSVLRRIFGS